MHDFETSVCRKELEELREEQVRREAKRLAQLAEQEANRKQLAEEKIKIDLLAKEALSMKEEAQKVRQTKAASSSSAITQGFVYSQSMQ